MIADQLVSTDRTLPALIPAPVNGTQFLRLTAAGFSTSTFDATDVGWDNPTLTVDVGSGGYLYNPSSSAQVFTFVGDVAQGTLTSPVTTAPYLFYSSRVPQAGLLQTDLGFVPADGDLIFKLSPLGAPQSYSFDAADGWSPGEPSLAVGEAFMLKPHLPHTPWVRVFNVN